LCGRLVEATSQAASPGAFDNARARVRDEAERALAIDPADPEARYALLSLDPIVDNWLAQESAIEAASARSPNSPLIIDALCRQRICVGRVREGLSIQARNYSTDPLSPRRIAQEMMRRHLVDNDIEGARQLCDAALAAAPGDEYVWRYCCAFLSAIGDWDAV